MVAQVDEDQIAMIALAMDPAGKPDLGPNSGRSERAASVRAVGVHGKFLKDSKVSAREATERRVLSSLGGIEGLPALSTPRQTGYSIGQSWFVTPPKISI
jgi:hypothetical protein